PERIQPRHPGPSGVRQVDHLVVDDPSTARGYQGCCGVVVVEPGRGLVPEVSGQFLGEPGSVVLGGCRDDREGADLAPSDDVDPALLAGVPTARPRRRSHSCGHALRFSETFASKNCCGLDKTTASGWKIGRAPCRESGQQAVVAAPGKKKRLPHVT